MILIYGDSPLTRAVFKVAIDSGLSAMDAGAQDALRHIVLTAETARLIGKPASRSPIVPIGIGRVIADQEGDAGLKGLVSTLQTQSNVFPSDSGYTAARPLKIDGDFGPRINDRLREVVRTNGAGPVMAATS